MTYYCRPSAASAWIHHTPPTSAHWLNMFLKKPSFIRKHQTVALESTHRIQVHHSPKNFFRSKRKRDKVCIGQGRWMMDDGAVCLGLNKAIGQHPCHQISLGSIWYPIYPTFVSLPDWLAHEYQALLFHISFFGGKILFKEQNKNNVLVKMAHLIVSTFWKPKKGDWVI